MSRRDGACWRHPSRRAAGVCADCLKERLTALSPEAPPPPPPQPQPPDRTSAFGFVVNRSSAHHHQQHKQNILPDSYLRRSKSWSHWEGGTAGGTAGSSSNVQSINHYNLRHHNAFGGRKSDAVLDDWTRQRFFSIFAKDQLKRPPPPAAAGSSCQDALSGVEFLKSSSGNDRGPARNAAGREAEDEDDRFRVNHVPPASTAGGNRRYASRWWASLLSHLVFRKPKKAKAKPASSASASASEKKVRGYTSSLRKVDEDRRRGSNINSGSSSNVSLSWISSPLRIFKGGGGNQKRGKRNMEDEEWSSRSIPSSTEIRRGAHTGAGTTTTTTTAYYRDYGAWSLSSSPVPNNRWSNGGGRGKQPWESRDMAAHSSSSPYHSVGSSSWNFYLTPLRPVKASGGSSSSSGVGTSLSKHRK